MNYDFRKVRFRFILTFVKSRVELDTMSNQKSSITEIIHENNQYSQKTKRFYVWLPVNLIFLSIVLHDVYRTHRTSSIIWYIEHVIALVLSLNIFYLCAQRFFVKYFPKKYSLSSHQYTVLQNFSSQISKGDCDINVTSEEKIHSQERKQQKLLFERFRPSSSPIFSNTSDMKADTPSNIAKLDIYSSKHYHASPTSLFSGTPIISDSFADISHQSSIDSYPGTFDGLSNTSMNSSNLSRNFLSFGKDEGYDEIDLIRKFPETASLNDSGGFWKTKDSILFRTQNVQRNDLILNDVYQLSPTTALESVKPVSEVSSLGANLSICKKFVVNQSYLSEWIANLRKWITQTILTRIIKEINDVNHALTVHGVTNVSIGSTGLERLKKTAAMSQVYQNIPSLSSLISFLDVSSNQEYVVQRISALSTGSMSNYCWNSGGSYEGKPWNESLPTDAALVMHLVAAYFDSQLFPLPHAAPDGRQFSSAHFVKTPAVPIKNKKSLIIYQQTINPPHFQLIIGEETYDISRGRNNLFHVLLFVLQHIKTKESGMFEHVNLGGSGINMLWIINEPSHSIYKNF